MTVRQLVVVVLLAGLAWRGASAAPPSSPASAMPRAFAFFDQSPTAQIYGLPRAGGYAVVGAGQDRLALHLSQSSHFIKQDSAAESLLFDGATTRAALVYAHGFGNGWQLSATLPFVAHSGGFADDWVVGFHRMFGLDVGARNEVADGQQLYRYDRNGDTLLFVNDSPSGIGDIRLALKKRLPGFGNWGVSVAAQLKLPTGAAQELTGSGGTDVAVWGVIGNNRRHASRWRLLAAAGLLYTSDGEVLPDMRRNVAGFGWFVLGYAALPDFVVRAQLYLHSAFYDDTGLEALDGTAVQGALGFDWRMTPQSSLSVALIEDLNAGVTPDVALMLSVAHAY